MLREPVLMETTVSTTMVADLLLLAGVACGYVEWLMRLILFVSTYSVAALTGMIQLHIARLFA